MDDGIPPRPRNESIRTTIWREEPRADNPFVPARTLCHGYDVEKLIDRCTWPEMVFLLLRGELPTADERALLNLLMVAVSNPGPRDPAVRAAMNCGVGKTPVSTILTTGLTVHGGMANGALNVEYAVRFLRGELRPAEKRDAPFEAPEALADYHRVVEEESIRVIVPLPADPPGFGLWFGARDPRAETLLGKLNNFYSAMPHCRRSKAVEEVLIREGREARLTLQGVFAAVSTDLGFSPEQSAGLYLLAGSAGILAHGIEQIPRKWNEYPFWADPRYFQYVGPAPPEDRDEPQ